MTSRLVQTAVFLVSALAIVGGALPSAAIEILTTLDNFEEGPFQVEDTTVDDGAESDFQQGLSNDNVLAGQRLVVGDLESGTRTSGDLTLSPDDDGVILEFDEDSGGRWTFVYLIRGIVDLTVGGADRFAVTISEAEGPGDARLGVIVNDESSTQVRFSAVDGAGVYSLLFADFPGVDFGQVEALVLYYCVNSVSNPICPEDALPPPGEPSSYTISDFSTAVPEPSTATLLLVGLGARLIRRRRRA